MADQKIQDQEPPIQRARLHVDGPLGRSKRVRAETEYRFARPILKDFSRMKSVPRTRSFQLAHFISHRT